MAEQYLVWRKGLDPMVGEDPLVWSGHVIFQLWQKRVPPYGTISDGDTAYLLDKPSGRIVWEWRIRHLVRQQYESRAEVFSILHGAYGLEPDDLNLYDYVFDAPASGFLLAWTMDVISALDVELPSDVKLGDLGFRSGYAPLSGLPADITERLDLPQPGRPPVVVTEVDVEPQARGDGSKPAAALRRVIPAHVRREVIRRDSGLCRSCGRGRPDVDLHIDHIRPFSRGGSNTLDNLQVLCAGCNLQKSNRIDGPVPAPVWSPEAARMRAERIAELRRSVDGGGPAEDVLELVALDVAMPETEAVSLLQRAAEDDRPEVWAEARWRLATLLHEDDPRQDALELEVLSSGVEPWASWAAAMVALRVSDDDPDRSRQLAERALSSDEVDLRAEAARVLIRLCGGEDDAETERLTRIVASASDPDLRAEACLDLVDLGVPDADALARQALAATRPELRDAAAAHLGLLG